METIFDVKLDELRLSIMDVSDPEKLLEEITEVIKAHNATANGGYQINVDLHNTSNYERNLLVANNKVIS